MSLTLSNVRQRRRSLRMLPVARGGVNAIGAVDSLIVMLAANFGVMRGRPLARKDFRR